ncbi:MAG: sulfur carrier protein ThiS [Gemmatimonadota bacterium]
MNDSRIQIRLNGHPRGARRGQTVAELLDELEVDRRLVVVEVNRQIVRRNELQAVTLEPDDQVELVHFVGGG